MLGNLVAPFVATPIAAGGDETRNSRWGLFYLFPLGMGVLNVVLVLVAFRDSVPWKRAGQTTSQGTGATDERSGKNKIAIKEMKDTLRLPAVWLLSLFYFFYLGASFTAGGTYEFFQHRHKIPLIILPGRLGRRIPRPSPQRIPRQRGLHPRRRSRRLFPRPLAPRGAYFPARRKEDAPAILRARPNTTTGVLAGTQHHRECSRPELHGLFSRPVVRYGE